MKVTNNPKGSWRALMLGCGALVVMGLTGCQSDIGGQTLPSPNYLQDDVQYFPPSPQFKLYKEAAAQKAYSLDAAVQR